jgi:hypothetical protein
MAAAHQRTTITRCVMLRGFHLRRNFNICQEPKAAGRTSAAENVAAIETRRSICDYGLRLSIRCDLPERLLVAFVFGDTPSNP